MISDRRHGVKKEEEEVDETKVRVRRKTEKELIAAGIEFSK